MRLPPGLTRPSSRTGAAVDASASLPVTAWELWFDTIPMGLAWLDARGSLLRANHRFRALTGWDHGALFQTSIELQQLFGWGQGQAWPPVANSLGAPVPDATGPAAVFQNTVRLPQADGQHLGLRLRLHAWRDAGWHPDRPAASGVTYLCTLEDLRIEDERDHVRLQLDTLMNAASVGVATFESSAPATRTRADAAVEDRPQGAASLQSISRDLVTADSADAFLRVQAAVKAGAAAQARYAIQHPQLGLRWLLTRVEPGTTSSGQYTTSVVTLDVTEEHAARERSEQLLKELTTILESSPAGIAYLRGLQLVRCNSRFEKMLGIATEPGSGPSAGRPLRDVLVGVEQGQEVMFAALRALADHESFETEIDLTLPGTDQRACYALTVRRLGPPTASVEAVAILNDITRRKKQQVEMQALTAERQIAQEAVAAQAERTRAILDSVFVGIVTVGQHGIEWMNRSARRMFGGDLLDFSGLPISTVATHEADHPFRHTDHLNELPEGQAHTFECQVKARDGRVFWVVGNAVATTGSRGQRQITYALLDIERRRQAEARTAEAQASLQRIIEMAPLAITLRDAKTLRILQLNQVAASLIGFPRDQAIGKSPEELYSPDDAASLRADIETALADSQPTQREYRSEREGETRWWEARYLPLAQPGCPPDQLLLVSTDVTDQRLAQEAKLEDAIAQREKLVREVHHRIKNNLQGVAGLLQQIAANKPEVASAISEVVGQVQAIAQVYGLQVGSTGPLKVRSVVEAIAQSLHRTFNRPVALSVEGDSAPQWMLPEAESIPIALCLNELLTNAIKHGLHGDVRCTLRCGEDAVDIEVCNSGDLPQGFSLERVPGGVSGLGLVRALLPRRSARLSLDSGPCGVVATVHLVAPGVSRHVPGTPQEPTGQQITLWPQ